MFILLILNIVESLKFKDCKYCIDNKMYYNMVLTDKYCNILFLKKKNTINKQYIIVPIPVLKILLFLRSNFPGNFIRIFTIHSISPPAWHLRHLAINSFGPDSLALKFFQYMRTTKYNWRIFIKFNLMYYFSDLLLCQCSVCYQ